MNHLCKCRSVGNFIDNLFIDTSVNEQVSKAQQAILDRQVAEGKTTTLNQNQQILDNNTVQTAINTPGQSPTDGLIEGAKEGAQNEMSAVNSGLNSVATLPFKIIPASVWFWGIAALAVVTYPTWGPLVSSNAKKLSRP